MKLSHSYRNRGFQLFLYLKPLVSMTKIP